MTPRAANPVKVSALSGRQWKRTYVVTAMLRSKKEGSLLHDQNTEYALDRESHRTADVTLVAIDIPFSDLVIFAVKVSAAFLVASMVIAVILALFYGAFLITK